MMKKVICAQLLILGSSVGCSALAAGAELRLGSVAVYSDGRAEKLLSKDAAGILWEDDRKRRLLRSTNPVLPTMERADFLSGKGYRQIVRDGEPNRILSLPTSTPVEFSLARTRLNGKVSKRNWECVYLGDKIADVLGEQQMLSDYSCQRFVVHRKFWTKQFRERREFSYSRALGLVVEMNRQTRKRSKHRRLIALFSPEEATYAAISKVVKKIHKRNSRQ